MDNINHDLEDLNAGYPWDDEDESYLEDVLTDDEYDREEDYWKWGDRL